MVLKTMTGELLGRLLESQFTAGRVSNLFQVSEGFSYTYDLWRPAGHRVEVNSIRIDGRPLALTRRYQVLVNEFLANGGDGFDLFREATGWVDCGADIDALVAYFQAHSPVRPGPQNRIKSERDTSASR